MKKLILMMAFAMPLLFTSCSSDDECTSSDWAGTYKGTNTCDEPNEEVTFVIKDAGNGKIDIDGVVITPDNCSFSQSFEIFGIEVDTKYTLDGNNLTIDNTTLGINCSFTVKK